MDSIRRSLPACAKVYQGLLTGEEETSVYWVFKGPHTSGKSFQLLLHSAPHFGKDVTVVRLPGTRPSYLGSRKPDKLALHRDESEALPTVLWSLPSAAYANYVAWLRHLSSLIPSLITKLTVAGGAVGEGAVGTVDAMVRDLQGSQWAIDHFYQAFCVLAGADAAAEHMPLGGRPSIPTQLLDLLPEGTVMGTAAGAPSGGAAGGGVGGAMGTDPPVAPFTTVAEIHRYARECLRENYDEIHVRMGRNMDNHHISDYCGRRGPCKIVLPPNITMQAYNGSLLGLYHPTANWSHAMATFVLQRATCFVMWAPFGTGTVDDTAGTSMSMDKVFTNKTHVPCNVRAVQYRVNADRNARY